MGPLRATATTGLSRDRVIDVQSRAERTRAWPPCAIKIVDASSLRAGQNFGLKKDSCKTA